MSEHQRGKGHTHDEKSLQLAGRSVMSCNYFCTLGIEIGPSIKESRKQSQIQAAATPPYLLTYSLLMDLMTNPHVNQNREEWKRRCCLPTAKRVMPLSAIALTGPSIASSDLPLVMSTAILNQTGIYHSGGVASSVHY